MNLLGHVLSILMLCTGVGAIIWLALTPTVADASDESWASIVEAGIPELGE